MNPWKKNNFSMNISTGYKNGQLFSMVRAFLPRIFVARCNFRTLNHKISKNDEQEKQEKKRKTCLERVPTAHEGCFSAWLDKIVHENKVYFVVASDSFVPTILRKRKREERREKKNEKKNKIV